jgi:hypothetical protein
MPWYQTPAIPSLITRTIGLPPTWLTSSETGTPECKPQLAILAQSKSLDGIGNSKRPIDHGESWTRLPDLPDYLLGEAAQAAYDDVFQKMQCTWMGP